MSPATYTGKWNVIGLCLSLAWVPSCGTVRSKEMSNRDTQASGSCSLVAWVNGLVDKGVMIRVPGDIMIVQDNWETTRCPQGTRRDCVVSCRIWVSPGIKMRDSESAQSSWTDSRELQILLLSRRCVQLPLGDLFALNSRNRVVGGSRAIYSRAIYLYWGLERY